MHIEQMHSQLIFRHLIRIFGFQHLIHTSRDPRLYFNPYCARNCKKGRIHLFIRLTRICSFIQNDLLLEYKKETKKIDDKICPQKAKIVLKNTGESIRRQRSSIVGIICLDQSHGQRLQAMPQSFILYVCPHSFPILTNPRVLNIMSADILWNRSVEMCTHLVLAFVSVCDDRHY